MKDNRCRLCGAETSLTKEHVPPQSCGNKGHMKNYQSFMWPDTLLPMQIKQNGIYYSSLCANCNNNIMGQEPDKALETIYKQVQSQMGNLYYEKVITITSLNIENVIKCLFGKFLAMDSFYNEHELCEKIRIYILRNDLPDDLGLYIRIYPFRKTIQSRNVGIYPVSPDYYGPKGICSLLYFYPLAFILTDQKQTLNMPDLIEYFKINKTSTTFDINVNTAYNPYTKELLPYDWLNNPSDGDYILIIDHDAVNTKGEL